MIYMGSKSRIVKDIAPIIQDYIDRNNIGTYIELFVGGANVIDHIRCNRRIGNDKNKYLIALLKHVADGGELLESVPKELYSEVRANYKTGKYEDWYVGNVGFLASYNGRFFDGGYAHEFYEQTKTGVRLRDYYQEAKRNLLSQVKNILDVDFLCDDYLNYKPTKYMIYCDPQYKGTKRYNNAMDFNHDTLWQRMRELAMENIVIVSELSAPDDFECIWEKSVSRTMKSTDNTMRATEKMFMYKSGMHELKN